MQMPRTTNLVLALCGSLLVVGAGLTQQGQPEPVASVTQIMQAMVIPASNVLFDVARQAPESDEDWATVRNNAVLLAESGNLLLMAGRSQATAVWRDTSLGMVRAGALALRRRSRVPRSPEGDRRIRQPHGRRLRGVP